MNVLFVICDAPELVLTLFLGRGFESVAFGVYVDALRAGRAMVGTVMVGFSLVMNGLNLIGCMVGAKPRMLGVAFILPILPEERLAISSGTPWRLALSIGLPMEDLGNFWTAQNVPEIM